MTAAAHARAHASALYALIDEMQAVIDQLRSLGAITAADSAQLVLDRFLAIDTRQQEAA